MIDQAAAADQAAFAEAAQAELAQSRAAQAQLRQLRRADSAAPITTEDETTPAPARIDALADDLSANTRASIGASHISLTPRLHRAGRAAALPALRWPPSRLLT